MHEFTESNPLPMRIPATHPPVAGDHIDVGVWPGGWRFLTQRDRLRFDALDAADGISQSMMRGIFDAQAAALAERDAPIVLDPKGDDAATLVSWSDRNPATIVKRTPKRITVRRDRVEQFSAQENIDSGLAYSRGHGDVVVFIADESAPLETYTLRQTGHWVRVGSSCAGAATSCGSASVTTTATRTSRR